MSRALWAVLLSVCAVIHVSSSSSSTSSEPDCVCVDDTCTFTAAPSLSQCETLLAFDAAASGAKNFIFIGNFECEIFWPVAQYPGHKNAPLFMLQSVSDVVVDARGANFSVTQSSSAVFPIDGGNFDTLPNIAQQVPLLAIYASTDVTVYGLHVTTCLTAVLVQCSLRVTFHELTVDYAYGFGLAVFDTDDYSNLFLHDSIVSLHNSVFANCHGPLMGGSIIIQGKRPDRRASLYFCDGAVYNSSVTNYNVGKRDVSVMGMSMSALWASVTINGVVFDGGTYANADPSSQSGIIPLSGLIHIQDSDFEFRRVTIRNGKGDPVKNQVYGGGVYITVDSDVYFTDSLFVHNTAAIGGAVYISSSRVCDTDRWRTYGGIRDGVGQCSTESSNVPENPRVRFYNCNFKSNLGTAQVGGIYQEGPSYVEITYTGFYDNQVGITTGAGALKCTAVGDGTVLTTKAVRFHANQLNTDGQAVECSTCGCCQPGGDRVIMLGECGLMDGNHCVYGCPYGYAPTVNDSRHEREDCVDESVYSTIRSSDTTDDSSGGGSSPNITSSDSSSSDSNDTSSSGGPVHSITDSTGYSSSIASHSNCGRNYRFRCTNLPGYGGFVAPSPDQACPPIPCPMLDNPLGGVMSTLFGSHGSSSTVQCSPGYSVLGEDTIDCVAGEWSGVTYCEPSPCQNNLTALTNGFVNATGERVGATAAFVCDVGYTLVGAKSAECRVVDANPENPLVQWVLSTNSTPSCVPTTCDTRAGLSYLSDCGSAGAYQQTCQFYCAAGYHGQPATAVCQQTAINGAGAFDSGFPQCNGCVKNTYSLDGATTCTPCTNAATAVGAAPGPMSCLCNQGYFHDEPISGTCSPCPKGAYCAGGTVKPVAASGYIESSGAYIQCVPLAACAGANSCGDGYEGHLCGLCSAGYYRLNGECHACNRSAGANVAAAVILLMIALLLLIPAAAPNRFGGKEKVWAVPHIAVLFLQIIAVFQDVRFEWPAVLLRLQSVFSAINFNVDLLNLECAMPTSFYDRLYFYLSLPLVVIGLYGVAFGVMVLWSRARSKHVTSTMSQFHQVAAGYILFLDLFYLAVTRYTFALFACFKQGDGTIVLGLATSTECYTPEWHRAVAYGVFGLVVYTFGIPALMYGVFASLNRRGGAASHPLTHSYVGRYKEKYVKAEFGFLLVRFLLSLILAAFAQQSVIQAVLCGLLLFLACLAISINRPFARIRDDRVASAAFVGAFAVLFAGLITASNVSAQNVEAIGYVTLVLVIVTLVILAFFGAEDIWMHWTSSRARAQAVKELATLKGNPRFLFGLDDGHVVRVTDKEVTIDEDSTFELKNAAVGAAAHGKRMVFAEGKSVLSLYDALEGEKLDTVNYPSDMGIVATALSPQLAAIGGGNTVLIYRIDENGKFTGEPTSVEPFDGRVEVTALHVATLHVLVGSNTGTVARITDGKLLGAWQMSRRGITALASRDSWIFAGNAGGAITIFDVAAAQRLAVLRGHSGAVTCLVSQGALLGSASHDGTWRLWDLVKSFEPLVAMPANGPLLALTTARRTGDANKAGRSSDDAGDSADEEASVEAAASALGHDAPLVLWSAGADATAYRITPTALREAAKVGGFNCRRKKEALPEQPITARVSINGRDEEDLWTHDGAIALRQNLSGKVNPSMTGALDESTLQGVYRAAHVSGHVDLTGGGGATKDKATSQKSKSPVKKKSSKKGSKKGSKKSRASQSASRSRSVSRSRSKSPAPRGSSPGGTAAKTVVKKIVKKSPVAKAAAKLPAKAAAAVGGVAAKKKVLVKKAVNRASRSASPSNSSS